MPDMSMGDLVSFDYQPQQDLGGMTPTDWASNFDSNFVKPTGGFSVQPAQDFSQYTNPSYFQPDVLSSQGMYPQTANPSTGWMSNPQAPYSPDQGFGYNTPNFNGQQTLAPNVGNA